MSNNRYDVVVIGDFRFPGGTSTAIAEELQAQARAGYKTGLLQVKGPILRYPHPFHPQIRDCIDQGLVELLDPDIQVTASLVVAHHPSLFANLPRRRLLVESDQRLLIVHHPPEDAQGVPSYDLESCVSHAASALDDDVIWAPVGPAVRQQLEMARGCPSLLPEDWYNILDPEPWHVRRDAPLDRLPIAGRHSRPDPLKWPDDRETVLQAYPDDPSLRVRILGGGPYLQDLVGSYPKNWEVWGFNDIEPQAFLGMIDVFVYFHHSHWIEAFGRTVLEAMASGCVLVLPQHFEPLFGDGAVYAEPAEVLGVVQDLHADWHTYTRQSRLGVERARQQFGPDVHVERVKARIGPPAADTTKSIGGWSTPPAEARATSDQTSAAIGQQARRPVLFMTSNGVGMGHLVRMMAVARRCSDRIQPIFLSMSQAINVLRDQGYLTEFLPSHAYLDVDNATWNKHLRNELNELISFYDPAAMIFDGSVPYGGLLGAIEDNPDPLFVWCRRGMWRANTKDNIVKRERHFHAVIEPGELAAAYDEGVTVQHRERTVLVPPIRLLDEDEMLSAEAARAELGLDQNRPAVLFLLGSGNNFHFGSFRQSAIHQVTQVHKAQVVIGEWSISEQAPADDDSYQRLPSFPFSRYFKAFDLVMSAVGYNSFHELMLAGVPVIFVPNEHQEMDDHGARARFAEHQGLARVVRTQEVYRMSAAIDELLDPAERARIAERATTLERANGAEDAARLIEEMAFSRRADLP